MHFIKKIINAYGTMRQIKYLKIMKKLLCNFSCIVVLAILISGCATHYGFMSGSASLSSNNFKMIKFAKGECTTTKVFGIGGLGKNALVAEAKRNLLENNPLKDGQTLANVTVDFKTSIIFIVIKTKATVTADIIEFK
jgi:hypothetical protein